MEDRMSGTLGNMETQLLAFSQMRGSSAVRSEEIVEALGLTAAQTRELLSRMARRGLIARVRRGLYLVPPRLPPGGKWNPSEFLSLDTLIKDRGGNYQICGPSAFVRYGFDEQVPNRVYAYNNVLTGQRKIGSASFTLIKVNDSRLGDTDTFTTPDGIKAAYSSRARTLVDAVYDWSRFGSLPRAFDWIRAELKRAPEAAKLIASAAIRFSNLSTLRRLGKLLSLEGVEEHLLRKIERKLPKTSAEIPWCPTRAKRGTIDRRWGVVFNG
jgi:predicted transcriptional regulator of viral defense system